MSCSPLFFSNSLICAVASVTRATYTASPWACLNVGPCQLFKRKMKTLGNPRFSVGAAVGMAECKLKNIVKIGMKLVAPPVRSTVSSFQLFGDDTQLWNLRLTFGMDDNGIHTDNSRSNDDHIEILSSHFCNGLSNGKNNEWEWRGYAKLMDYSWSDWRKGLARNPFAQVLPEGPSRETS